MAINESKINKLWRRYEILKAQFVSESGILIVHPSQQLDQSPFVIHFFSTGYVRLICLLANAKKSNNIATAPMFPAFGTFRDRCVRTLAETVPNLQFIDIGTHPANASIV